MEFKSIFLDTNILVDLVAKRNVFVNDAVAIFNYCQNNNIEMFTTSHSIATLHYIAKKLVNEKELRLIIEDLLDTVSIIGVNEITIRKSLKSNHKDKDFEDAIQIISAQSINNMNCIVTRNIKDYKYTEINVFTPNEFLNKLNV